LVFSEAVKINSDESTALLRLVDANLNRLKEGIRVVEDICRFVFEFKDEASRLKALRHNARSSELLEALKHRDTNTDILKSTTKTEKNRENIASLLIANFKRAQESARTLEEALKLFSTDEAENFKKIRYELYDIEKSLFAKLPIA
jgi:thiamine-phosphate pyrophosphorylase